jgi:hypothetical protein
MTQPNTRLTGRWLTIARATWIVVVLLGLSLFVISAPAHLADLRASSFGGERSSTQIYLLTPDDARILERLGLSTGFYAGYVFAFEIIWVFSFCAPALLIFWRKSGERMALFVAFMLVTVGIFSPPSITALITSRPALGLILGVFMGLGFTAMINFFYLFPDGHFVPRWTRWLALASLAVIPAVLVYLLVIRAASVEAGLSGMGPVVLVFAAPGLLGQIYRYGRVSSAVQRQQTKWVVFGVMAGSLGVTLVLLSWAVLPSLTQTGFPRVLLVLANILVNVLSVCLIPWSLGLSILRYRLWDIDLLIRRTLQYSLLSGLLALTYFGLIVILQSVFTAVSGQSSSVALVLSTLAIAGLFLPLRRRVQAFIDKRFYRQKYDAAKVVAEFAATCRDETDLDNLTARLVEVVDETMQPESVTLWLIDSNAKSPGLEGPK